MCTRAAIESLETEAYISGKQSDILHICTVNVKSILGNGDQVQFQIDHLQQGSATFFALRPCLKPKFFCGQV